MKLRVNTSALGANRRLRIICDHWQLVPLSVLGFNVNSRCDGQLSIIVRTAEREREVDSEKENMKPSYLCNMYSLPFSLGLTRGK